MPSPITHVTAGYIVYRFAKAGSRTRPEAGTDVVLLASAVILSLLPDFDSVLGILMGDFGRYHNNLSHSLLVGLMVALAVGGLSSLTTRDQFGLWFGLALACYQLHIVLDYFTWGRGVMAFWPITPERFSPPVALFYGFHWSEGLVSHRHLWTLLTEAPLAAALVAGVRRLTPREAPAGG
jgi:inner membrane protein